LRCIGARRFAGLRQEAGILAVIGSTVRVAQPALLPVAAMQALAAFWSFIAVIRLYLPINGYGQPDVPRAGTGTLRRKNAGLLGGGRASRDLRGHPFSAQILGSMAPLTVGTGVGSPRATSPGHGDKPI